MHGGWRHNRGTTFVRREDGLDENGEAPPPYEPKSPDPVSPGCTGAAPPSGLTIPTPALPRGGGDSLQPPDYQEVIGGQGGVLARSDTGETHMTRPETAYTAANVSTRDLLRNQGPLEHPG